MNNAQLRDEARFYFVPVLLGSNAASRKLSRRIFRKYGIVSYLLDEKRSLPDLLNISGKFLNHGKTPKKHSGKRAIHSAYSYSLQRTIPSFHSKM